MCRTREEQELVDQQWYQEHNFDLMAVLDNSNIQAGQIDIIKQKHQDTFCYWRPAINRIRTLIRWKYESSLGPNEFFNGVTFSTTDESYYKKIEFSYETNLQILKDHVALKSFCRTEVNSPSFEQGPTFYILDAQEAHRFLDFLDKVLKGQSI